MATLTKKDLLEAIEDMPMDAEVMIVEDYYNNLTSAFRVSFDEKSNTIILC